MKCNQNCLKNAGNPRDMRRFQASITQVLVIKVLNAVCSTVAMNDTLGVAHTDRVTCCFNIFLVFFPQDASYLYAGHLLASIFFHFFYSFWVIIYFSTILVNKDEYLALNTQDSRQSRGIVLPVFVGIFIHTISQYQVQLGPPNLT